MRRPDEDHVFAHVFRRKWRVGGDTKADRQPDVIRGAGGELADESRDLAASLDGERDPTHSYGRVKRVKAKFERCDDAEVGAGPADPPEQIWVLVRAGAHLAPVSGDEVDRQEVVDGQSELSLEASHAAAESEAGDASVSDDTNRANEPMGLRALVELG